MFSHVDTIYLLRHGETVWNVEQRKQGLDDSPLTALGQLQAENYARLLQQHLQEQRIPFEDVVVYVSPLGRTKATADYLIRTLRLSNENLIEEPRLIEFDYGRWSGLTNGEIEQQFPGEFDKRDADKWRYVVPGGESYFDVEQKVAHWAKELPKGKVIVAVTHSVVSRVIRGNYLGLDHQQAGQLLHSQNLFFKLSEGIETPIEAMG